MEQEERREARECHQQTDSVALPPRERREGKGEEGEGRKEGETKGEFSEEWHEGFIKVQIRDH